MASTTAPSVVTNVTDATRITHTSHISHISQASQLSRQSTNPLDTLDSPDGPDLSSRNHTVSHSTGNISHFTQLTDDIDALEKERNIDNVYTSTGPSHAPEASGASGKAPNTSDGFLGGKLRSTSLHRMSRSSDAAHDADMNNEDSKSFDPNETSAVTTHTINIIAPDDASDSDDNINGPNESNEPNDPTLDPINPSDSNAVKAANDDANNEDASQRAKSATLRIKISKHEVSASANDVFDAIRDDNNQLKTTPNGSGVDTISIAPDVKESDIMSDTLDVSDGGQTDSKFLSETDDMDADESGIEGTNIMPLKRGKKGLHKASKSSDEAHASPSARRRSGSKKKNSSKRSSSSKNKAGRKSSSQTRRNSKNSKNDNKKGKNANNAKSRQNSKKGKNGAKTAQMRRNRSATVTTRARPSERRKSSTKGKNAQNGKKANKSKKPPNSPSRGKKREPQPRKMSRSSSARPKQSGPTKRPKSAQPSERSGAKAKNRSSSTAARKRNQSLAERRREIRKRAASRDKGTGGNKNKNKNKNKNNNNNKNKSTQKKGKNNNTNKTDKNNPPDRGRHRRDRSATIDNYDINQMKISQKGGKKPKQSPRRKSGKTGDKPAKKTNAKGSKPAAISLQNIDKPAETTEDPPDASDAPIASADSAVPPETRETEDLQETQDMEDVQEPRTIQTIQVTQMTPKTENTQEIAANIASVRHFASAPETPVSTQLPPDETNGFMLASSGLPVIGADTPVTADTVQSFDPPAPFDIMDTIDSVTDTNFDPVDTLGVSGLHGLGGLGGFNSQDATDTENETEMVWVNQLTPVAGGNNPNNTESRRISLMFANLRDPQMSPISTSFNENSPNMPTTQILQTIPSIPSMPNIMETNDEANNPSDANNLEEPNNLTEGPLQTCPANPADATDPTAPTDLQEDTEPLQDDSPDPQAVQKVADPPAEPHKSQESQQPEQWQPKPKKRKQSLAERRREIRRRASARQQEMEKINTSSGRRSFRTRPTRSASVADTRSNRNKKASSPAKPAPRAAAKKTKEAKEEPAATRAQQKQQPRGRARAQTSADMVPVPKMSLAQRRREIRRRASARQQELASAKDDIARKQSKRLQQSKKSKMSKKSTQPDRAQTAEPPATTSVTSVTSHVPLKGAVRTRGRQDSNASVGADQVRLQRNSSYDSIRSKNKKIAAQKEALANQAQAARRAILARRAKLAKASKKAQPIQNRPTRSRTIPNDEMALATAQAVQNIKSKLFQPVASVANDSNDANDTNNAKDSKSSTKTANTAKYPKNPTIATNPSDPGVAVRPEPAAPPTLATNGSDDGDLAPPHLLISSVDDADSDAEDANSANAFEHEFGPAAALYANSTLSPKTAEYMDNPQRRQFVQVSQNSAVRRQMQLRAQTPASAAIQSGFKFKIVRFAVGGSGNNSYNNYLNSGTREESGAAVGVDSSDGNVGAASNMFLFDDASSVASDASESSDVSSVASYSGVTSFSGFSRISTISGLSGWSAGTGITAASGAMGGNGSNGRDAGNRWDGLENYYIKNEKSYKKDPEDYVPMTILRLTGNNLLASMNDRQRKNFEKILLMALENVQCLYKIEFNAAGLDDELLGKILDILARRTKLHKNRFGMDAEPQEEQSKQLKTMSKIAGAEGEYERWKQTAVLLKQKQVTAAGAADDNEEKGKDYLYGPEEIHIESNPSITERGYERILEYMRLDCPHLKILKCKNANDLSTSMCEKFVECLASSNKHIMKCSVNLRYNNDKQLFERYLSRNGNYWREMNAINRIEMKKAKDAGNV